MITIHRIELDQKLALRNLLELYKYDSSEFDYDDINENGLYEYKYLDHYWTEEGRHPFFIRVNGNLGGFALIREIGTNEYNQLIYSMAEFFIMRKYRRLGAGRQAAAALFDEFSGIWKVAQTEANKPAQAFWRKTIESYTNNSYREIREDGWEGPILTFSTETPSMQ